MTVNLRKLQRMTLSEIKASLPLVVTADGEALFEVVQIDSQRKQETLANLRKLIEKPKQIDSQASRRKQDDSQAEIPLYNPVVHRPGDTVRVLVGNRCVVRTIPRLDAEGQAIP